MCIFVVRKVSQFQILLNEYVTQTGTSTSIGVKTTITFHMSLNVQSVSSELVFFTPKHLGTTTSNFPIREFNKQTKVNCK